MTRAELVAAVLADPEALWAVRTANVRLAGVWNRSSSRSERQGDTESCSYGDHDPLVMARIEHKVTNKAGYRCPRECEKPGRGNYCQSCGDLLEYEPTAKAWRVTSLPDDVEQKLRGRDYMPPRYYFTADTREAAEAWCDARLREAGVLVVEGE